MSGSDIERIIAGRAAEADREDGDLSADIDLLRKAGWLTACLPGGMDGQGWGTDPGGTMAAFDALRSLGRANLSVARLFEGHMNAVKLLFLYGDARLRAETVSAVRDGILFGVWGADDAASPLSIEAKDGTIHLRGAKRFASGIGLVRRAVVSAPTPQGLQLLLLPVDDESRSDASCWRMGGMRATRSGRYDFDGVAIVDHCRMGAPGDYLLEPYFEGGIWRYCAAHLGAAEALYAEMRAGLGDRGRSDDPQQQLRLFDAAIAVETARLWIQRAAMAVEASDSCRETVTLSLMAREVTERSCRKVMAITQRALGTAAHVAGSPVERIGRDLSLFLCQAAPDAKNARGAEALARHYAALDAL